MPNQQRRVRFDLAGHALKPRFIDGQELANWQEGPEMTEYFRQLIEEGWHLASGDSSVRQLVFERQVQ